MKFENINEKIGKGVDKVKLLALAGAMFAGFTAEAQTESSSIERQETNKNNIEVLDKHLKENGKEKSASFVGVGRGGITEIKYLDLDDVTAVDVSDDWLILRSEDGVKSYIDLNKDGVLDRVVVAPDGEKVFDMHGNQKVESGRFRLRMTMRLLDNVSELIKEAEMGLSERMTGSRGNVVMDVSDGKFSVVNYKDADSFSADIEETSDFIDGMQKEYSEALQKAKDLL
jgi:hypothetical protein